MMKVKLSALKGKKNQKKEDSEGCGLVLGFSFFLPQHRIFLTLQNKHSKINKAIQGGQK